MRQIVDPDLEWHDLDAAGGVPLFSPHDILNGRQLSRLSEVADRFDEERRWRRIEYRPYETRAFRLTLKRVLRVVDLTLPDSYVLAGTCTSSYDGTRTIVPAPQESPIARIVAATTSCSFGDSTAPATHSMYNWMRIARNSVRSRTSTSKQQQRLLRHHPRPQALRQTITRTQA